MAQTRAQRWAPYRRRAILDANATTWEFYQKSLSDTSGLYTFSLTRASVATHIGSDGYIDEVASGAARYEHPAAGGACLGLLHEDAQDNVLTYSEDLSTNWSAVNASIADDATVVSPTGGTARKVTANGAGTARVQQAFTTVTSTIYCHSVFIRYGSLTQTTRQFRMYSHGDGAKYAEFLWDSGTSSFSVDAEVSVTAGVEEHVDGWWRLWCTGTETSGQSRSQQISSVPSFNPTNGDYWWQGCEQLEAVPYADSPPTSWIPTDSTSETRAKDQYKLAGDNFDVSSGFTYYAQLQDDETAAAHTHSPTYLSYANTDGSQRYSFRLTASALNNLTAIYDNGPTLETKTLTHTTTRVGTGAMFTTALSVTTNALVFASDSDTVTDATVAAPPSSGFNELAIGDDHAHTTNLCYRVIIREIRLYDKTHTEAELAALTT